ncbi:MAG: hypothetical protein MK291_12700, partial [Planctomycetes bacterium]|nr:hypothetical protein [Planctomycetota bacterium]
VRLEAFLGADVEAAKSALSAIGGVGEVRDLGQLGIHHVLEIDAVEDLREDVGALAHVKGWAIRELSYQQPTLEQVFARIAVGSAAEASEVDVDRPQEAPAQDAPVEVSSELGGALPMASPGEPGPAEAKQIYSLNPFDGGATRDLNKPTGADSTAPPADDCDQAEEGEA